MGTRPRKRKEKHPKIINRMTKTKHLAVAQIIDDIMNSLALGTGALDAADLAAKYGGKEAFLHLLRAIREHHKKLTE